MLIIGCDYHPGFQQIAFVDTEIGEVRRTATDSPRGSRAVLQDAQDTQGAYRDGSQRTRTLV
jgi:hypothetical protein